MQMPNGQKGIIGAAMPTEQAPQQQPQQDMPKKPQTTEVDGPTLEAFLDASGNLIKQVRNEILKSIETGGIEEAASIIFDRTDAKFKNISDTTRFFGGLGILAQIAELSKTSGNGEISEEDELKAISTVLARQIDKGIQSGEYDPNEMLAAAKEAQATMQQSRPQQEGAEPMPQMPQQEMPQ